MTIYFYNFPDIPSIKRLEKLASNVITNKTKLLNYSIEEYQHKPITFEITKRNTDNKNDVKINSKLFTVSSAGFNYGNFTEISIGNKILISKKDSKRGLTVLFLSNDLTNFFTANFDFHKETNQFPVNIYLIYFLKRIPNNTYFSLSIKDDASINILPATKRIIGRLNPKRDDYGPK